MERVKMAGTPHLFPPALPLSCLLLLPNHLSMSNIPANVAPSEIPDGFSLADPTGHAAAGASKQNNAAVQRDAQRQAILEQAMTPDALARLRRVKVCLYLQLLGYVLTYEHRCMFV